MMVERLTPIVGGKRPPDLVRLIEDSHQRSERTVRQHALHPGLRPTAALKQKHRLVIRQRIELGDAGRG
jgi:hypothetical protein